VILLLGVLAVLASLYCAVDSLQVAHREVAADAMVVLGGEPQHRPPRALELYQHGMAPKIIISGIGDCQETRILLAGKGVPESALQLECGSHTTRENAQFTIPLLRALRTKRKAMETKESTPHPTLSPIEAERGQATRATPHPTLSSTEAERGAQGGTRQLRVIIVTSWFHSRRALGCFRHYAPDIEFISVPTTADLPKGGWPDARERRWVLLEYAKLFYYWVRFGISPY